MLNEVNNNAQSIALNAGISAEETAAEQALNELSPIFMKSIEEQNSSAASSKSESMLKSMCKPRYLIPLTAVVTCTALGILAYAYQYALLEKMQSFINGGEEIMEQIATPDVTLMKKFEELKAGFNSVLENLPNLKEYVVQKDTLENAQSIANKVTISVAAIASLAVMKAVALRTILPNVDLIAFVA